MNPPNLSRSLHRRHFLRSMGTALTLPALHSLSSPQLKAKEGFHPATTQSGAPLRLAFVYFPNGAIPKHWWPDSPTSDLSLPATLSPLENVKSQLQILGGLDHVNATPGPDGAGDHARASGTFLTGVRVKKTAGSDIHAGVSIDQILARQIGHTTRFASLEMTCDAIRKSGSCDSGYSCAYQYNLAWSSPTQPLPPESNPRLFFERLFGAGSPGARQASLLRRRVQQKSILDFVLEEARDLERQLGNQDRNKLQDYLSSLRQIERRIEQAETHPLPGDPERQTPAGIPERLDQYMALMFDMLALAFQSDASRVATFLMQNEGSNRPFPELGIAEGHHYLTHHRNNDSMIEKVALIDQWYVAHLARFLENLDSMTDIDGHSILHNSMIVYGSGNSDGNRHTHVNLPILLAGSGGGTMSGNRFRDFGQTPMSNLLLSLGDRMGMQGVERLGDSSGRLSQL